MSGMKEQSATIFDNVRAMTFDNERNCVGLSFCYGLLYRWSGIVVVTFVNNSDDFCRISWSQLQGSELVDGPLI